LKKDTFKYRINNQISADKVRVIDPDGKQVGVMNLKKALKEAYGRKLDLVEIAPNSKPPVVKIIELGKFKYIEDKKRKKEKLGSKRGEIKEIRFSPFMGEADYKMRLKKVQNFLNQGFKIRAVVKFKGRQMGRKNFGYELIKKLIDEIDRDINIDMEPKFIGRHLTCVISPSTKIVKKKVKEKEDINKEKKDAKTKN